jgi:hypothetical protein
VKIEPKAFIAIERTVAASMAAVWDKLARKIMDELHPVLEAGKWQEAHGLADRLTMKGVVTEVRPKLEEAAVSALLFGAHHVHGSVKATSFAKGRKVPQEIQGALHQLMEAVEHDAADTVRNQLHKKITELQQQDATTHFQKGEPKIDRDHDVRLMSVLSRDEGTFYIDCDMPPEVTIKGKTFDPAEPLMHHEMGEFAKLKELVAEFKAREGREPNDQERRRIYDKAHYTGGNPAEKAWVEANGIDWKAWEGWCAGKLSTLEHKAVKNPPPDVDVAQTHGGDGEVTLKDDLSDEQLAETGGLQEPQQAQATKKKKFKRVLALKDEWWDTECPKCGAEIDSDNPKCKSCGFDVSKVKKADATLYVNRPLKNADELRAWAKTQGFGVAQAPEDMHVTICYSKTRFDWSGIKPQTDTVKVGEGARSLEQFGEGGSAIVLRFECNQLHQRWRELLDAGASWDHDGFKPHVTITWEGAPRPLDQIEPYRGPLIFGPEEFAEINPDWQADHEEEVLKRDKLRKADSLADQLNDAVLNGGKVAIDLGANLTTSRLVSLGFLAEALDAGVTTYQVNEVLDDRTCPVCQYMNGKTFDVANEHSRLIQALNTSDPQELKSISPWPGQSEDDLSELYGMSLEELQGAGYGSPPYHPGCRGMLHLAGTVNEEIPLGGPGLADLLPEAEAAGEAALAEHAPGTDWAPEDIDQLGWERFEVTDPKTLKEVNEAFEAGDYDTAQELIDKWKGAQLQKEEIEDSEGPNAPREKRKPKQRAGLETDYDDIKPDSSSIAFDAGTQNDNLAPLDRN